ncbi:histone deacetylase complex subunit SAP130a isoform X5 [Tachysurus fulvidraco]|uniref:histone deacetylase complex subunit SAP130a isoform X5 n=1 Tax=Tachysurus fulvidraco TaxID=1234273 RepID=UPI001FEE987E|nr:histone deacetylase complex subunit SAP130a isoform X5 [Tachysurus fulvidraco]
MDSIMGTRTVSVHFQIQHCMDSIMGTRTVSVHFQIQHCMDSIMGTRTVSVHFQIQHCMDSIMGTRTVSVHFQIQHAEYGKSSYPGFGGKMSSQQFPRAPLPPTGVGQGPAPAGNSTLIPGGQPGGEEGTRDADHPQDPLPSGRLSGAALQFRDDKQETVVVRPYPQVQTLSQTPALAQHMSIQPSATVTVAAPPAQLAPGQQPPFTDGAIKAGLKPGMPSRLIAPAPATSQGHLPGPAKVPGHITVTLESSMAPASIPVATISGQQGQGNVHHLTAVQIIRGNTPALQISSPTASPHTFTSHLPRGAAAAAVMSSTKGPTVLRPACGANAAPGQPAAVQHINHQSISSRPVATTSTAVLPTVVAPISTARTQSPVISPPVTHTAEIMRAGLTIHPVPPPATISIQRPPTPRETARITLPSHPAMGAQKAQPAHTMTQKSIFSTVAPVAAATVAPILATNTVPSTATTGSAPHTQMSSSTIVTMTMTSHSSHATAVTSSTIPVAKVVPQPIAHTSPRIQPEYSGERTNLISISGHRSSPNPVTMEARSDNRPTVPVQFQYFLPTNPPYAYPLTHTYTPITSSVSTIRPYPVTAQAPSSAIPAQAGVGVATTVHLNPMQLMAVDRIGLQSAQISTQNIQAASMTPQGIQPAPIGVQGLHATAPISTQGIQQAPVTTQQPQAESKQSSVVLAESTAFVTNPIGSTFSPTQPVTTIVQTHPQGTSTGAPTQVSSPRPSILRKKPVNEGAVRKTLIQAQSSEPSTARVDSGVRLAGSPRPAGVKPKPDIHVAMTPPVMATVEALPTHGGEQQPLSSPAQHLSQAIPALLAPPIPPPPSQSAAVLSALPAAMAITPPVPASMANAVSSPTQPAASSTAALSSTLPEIKVKQEAESMDTSQPALSIPSSTAPASIFSPQASGLTVPPQPGDLLLPGASPRKKPRKQQHVISNEEGEMMETNSTDEERASSRTPGSKTERPESPPREYVDEEGVRYVPVRPRPPITLLRHYRNPWKAAYHHFQRYSDIRVKEEKKNSLQDVANQRGVACRAQGWKVHLCAAQLKQLTSLEHDVYSRLITLQEGLIPKKRAGADDDLHRINELIQGNMQRCKLVMDQVTEARDTMMKVLDHKDRVLKLLNKNGTVKKSSKLKRKDRT